MIDPPAPYAGIEILALFVQDLEAKLADPRFSAGARSVIDETLRTARADLARAKLDWLRTYPFLGSSD